MAKIKLNKKKVEEIEVFLQNRFRELSNLRDEFDDDIKEEIDLYNDKDKYMDQKADWEEKITVPYIYTIVQTMVARLYQTLFGDDNYVRVFVEDETKSDMEKSLQMWIQEELDVMHFKTRSRDFLEDSLIQRTVWLQPRPVMNGKSFKGVDFNVIKWFDIWYDTTVDKVEDTDFFVRKIVKQYKILQRKDIYFNLDKIAETIMPDRDFDDNIMEEYEAKHGVTKNTDINTQSTTKDVEIMEWWGVYEIDGEYKEVIFTLANRKILIRAETNTTQTIQKRPFFPIRPLRQANSLVGKSVPQLTKNQQYELNETRSLRLQNFKTQIKLLFKYRRDAGINFGELFAKGGNIIGYDDLPTDIDIFNVPNMVQLASFISSEIIQDMQQITGAVDYLMGTTAARGVTETASGIRTITEQALFKFGMMAQNVYDDLIKFINYVIILWMRHGKSEILLRRPELRDFFKQSEEEIEKSYMVDISMQDLAMRRDIERSQFINAINIIAGLMAQVPGANMKELLKQIMKRFNMENIDKMFEAPQQTNVEQLGVGGEQARGGSPQIAPTANRESMPEEEAFGVQPGL